MVDAHDKLTELQRSNFNCQHGPPRKLALVRRPIFGVVGRSDPKFRRRPPAGRGIQIGRSVVSASNCYSSEMRSQIRSKYKWVRFTVEPSTAPGIYVFRFKVAGEEVTGRAKIGLVGIAIVRAKSAIDRRLRTRLHDAP
jgi:hypothetical protein